MTEYSRVGSGFLLDADDESEKDTVDSVNSPVDV
jgi:hypothetical protein